MAKKLINQMGMPKSIVNIFTARNIITTKDALSHTDFELMELLDVGKEEVTSAMVHISGIVLNMIVGLLDNKHWVGMFLLSRTASFFIEVLILKASRSLAEFSRIPVVLTNQVRSQIGDESRMYSFQAQRFIKLAKSPISPPLAFPFKITSSGLVLLDDEGIEMKGPEINTIHCQGLSLSSRR